MRLIALSFALVAGYHNTPRKCLDWKTPREALYKSLKPLHFEWESTSRRKPG